MPTPDAATCRGFLLSEPRPAMLATVGADGSPHLAPIWVDMDDTVGEGVDVIVFETGADTVKGRNLTARPAVAISVQDPAPPYSFVTAVGTATPSEELAEVKEWAGRLGARYLGEDQRAVMAERNGVPGELLVRVRVDRWIGALDVAAD